MPVPENPQSYDPTGSEESTRVERFHRSAGFRYAAVVVCGIGLATASSTFLRLSQGWRDAPRPAAESAGGPVTTVATAPAPPLSTGLERHPTLPPEPEPARPAVQPAAPEPRMTAESPQPIAPEVPGPSSSGRSAMTMPSGVPPLIEPSPIPAEPERPSNPSPPSEPLKPAPMVPGPVGLGGPERRPGPAPAPAKPQQPRRSAEQDSRAPPREVKPSAPRRTRSRYAIDREPTAPAQFGRIAAPAGTAPNVRAYSFAASGGRVIDASGTRVQIIRVR